MAIEIMDLPIDSMVDLSIVMLVYQRVSNMNMDYQWKITIII